MSNKVPEIIRNCGDSPSRPGVPGPVISAKTLTMANRPLIIPYPRPDTKNNESWKE